MDSIFKYNWSYSIKNNKYCFGGVLFIDVILTQGNIEVNLVETKLENNIALAEGGAIYITRSWNRLYLITYLTSF